MADTSLQAVAAFGSIAWLMVVPMLLVLGLLVHHVVKRWVATWRMWRLLRRQDRAQRRGFVPNAARGMPCTRCGVDIVCYGRRAPVCTDRDCPGWDR